MKYLQGVIILLTLSVFCVGGLVADNHGNDEVLRIAWAEWPPADYLQELSKDFTQETGIGVEIVQIHDLSSLKNPILRDRAAT